MAQYTMIYIVGVFCLLVVVTAMPFKFDFISNEDPVTSNGRTSNQGEKLNIKNSNDVVTPELGEEQNILPDHIGNNNQVSSNEDWDPEIIPRIIKFIRIINVQRLDNPEKQFYEQSSEEANDIKPQGRAAIEQTLEDQNSKESVEHDHESGSHDLITNNGDEISKEIPRKESDSNEEKNDSEKEVIHEAPELPPLDNSIIEFIKENELHKPKDQESVDKTNNSKESVESDFLANNDEVVNKEVQQNESGSNDEKDDNGKNHNEIGVIPDASELPSSDNSKIEFIKENEEAKSKEQENVDKTINSQESGERFLANNGDVVNKVEQNDSENNEDKDDSEKEVIQETPEQKPIIEFIKENEYKPLDQETVDKTQEQHDSKEFEENKPLRPNVEQLSEEQNSQNFIKPESVEQAFDSETPIVFENNDKISNNEIPITLESEKEREHDQNVIIPEAPELSPLDPSIIEYIKEEGIPPQIIEQTFPEQNFGEIPIEIPEGEENNEESNYAPMVDAPIEFIPEVYEEQKNPVIINKPKPSFLSGLYSYLPSFPFSYWPSFSFHWPFFRRSYGERYPEYNLIE